MIIRSLSISTYHVESPGELGSIAAIYFKQPTIHNVFSKSVDME